MGRGFWANQNWPQKNSVHLLRCLCGQMFHLLQRSWLTPHPRQVESVWGEGPVGGVESVRSEDEWRGRSTWAASQVLFVASLCFFRMMPSDVSFGGRRICQHVVMRTSEGQLAWCEPHRKGRTGACCMLQQMASSSFSPSSLSPPSSAACEDKSAPKMSTLLEVQDGGHPSWKTQVTSD